MPKLTKENNNSKNDNHTDNDHNNEVEEVEISNDSNNETDSENDTATETKKQKKLTAHELYAEIAQKFQQLDEAEEEYIEKEKEFEKEKKDHHNYRKKMSRDINCYMKRFEKALNAEVGKKKKPRKTENAGKGGFNKQTDVPEILRNYIGIDEDDKKSRPEITKLLNAKFFEAGLMTVKKDDNNKEIKMIVLDKATAKKLKRKEGDEIRNKDIQTFIAQFYREASNNINA